MTATDNTNTIENVQALFSFIHDMCKQAGSVLDHVREYSYRQFLSELPECQDITQMIDWNQESEQSVCSGWLLSIQKPVFDDPPIPLPFVSAMLNDGWDDDQNPLSFKEAFSPLKAFLSSSSCLQEELDEEQKQKIKRIYPRFFQQFDASLLEEWITHRKSWQQKQQIKRQVLDLFQRLFHLRQELERNADLWELVIADGFWLDAANPDIEHPILMKKVSLAYEPQTNSLQILDTEDEPFLYTELFSQYDEFNADALQQAMRSLSETPVHPLSLQPKDGFLQSFSQSVSDSCIWYSSGIDPEWKTRSRFAICSNPVLLLRKKQNGPMKAIEEIQAQIRETQRVPAQLARIVEGGSLPVCKKEEEPYSPGRALAQTSGEDPDILLGNLANREQLEIAKKAMEHPAVLVQGPPGTGKTHTIANLTGHFLAQGKTVLITSQTSKALRVLKDKLPSPIQPLCVAMTDSGHKDMEKAIDNITEMMATTSAHTLEQTIARITQQRDQIMEKQSCVREKIYTALKKETACLVIQGESFTPMEAAQYLAGHASENWLSDAIAPDAPLPLSLEEFDELSALLASLDQNDQTAEIVPLPDPSLLLPVKTMQEIWNEEAQFEQCLQHPLLRPFQGTVHWGLHPRLTIQYEGQSLVLDTQQCAQASDVLNLARLTLFQEPWMAAAALAGDNDSPLSIAWKNLLLQIREVSDSYEKTVLDRTRWQFELPDPKHISLDALSQLTDILVRKGKPGRLFLLSHKEVAALYAQIRVNGHAISHPDEVEALRRTITFEQQKRQVRKTWSLLMEPAGAPAFDALDPLCPELVARQWIEPIQDALQWEEQYEIPFEKALLGMGIPLLNASSQMRRLDPLHQFVQRNKQVKQLLIPLLECLSQFACLANNRADYTRMTMALRSLEDDSFPYGEQLMDAIIHYDLQAYQSLYEKIQNICASHKEFIRTEELLNHLARQAPLWARSIKNKEEGFYPLPCPSSVAMAWKLAQMETALQEISLLDLDELQKQSTDLSKAYRESTRQLAAAMTWKHLLEKAQEDVSLQQALQGWKQLVRKIGKGTGKRALALKRQARTLMETCQQIIPAWIMPFSKVLETMSPVRNHFDVVIIDEASQCDLSAMILLYMGSKIIIVGDHNQVSPMAIGCKSEQTSALQKLHLEGKVKHYFLYDAQTSIYDIAMTSFQPLMLKEHFRCVPDIIGFSSMLCYDNKIRPLRDARDTLLQPSMVVHRVLQGKRLPNRKCNPREAHEIVCLLQACLERKEYEGKTFGIISLLGDEQVREIQRQVESYIDPAEMDRRKILVGNAANFQGDERDVIFLSLVDSNHEGSGPLRKMGDGLQDAIKKRYNVAVSRAKDQLWIVHSLDVQNDLKPKDLRRVLLEYAQNPQSMANLLHEARQKTESPFEEDVARALLARHFRLHYQYPVGSYRLDFVVEGIQGKVALECDGQRWHSSEEQIRHDMERQTILERIGWRFIRISGADYYRNPVQTMARVVARLHELGIDPDDDHSAKQEDLPDCNDLIRQIRLRAQQLQWQHSKTEETDQKEDLTGSMAV